jgi:hypothetical protein
MYECAEMHRRAVDANAEDVCAAAALAEPPSNMVEQSQ